MSDTWEKLFRQVALKGNLLKASVAATLETAYSTATIGASEMLDRGSQFPKTAVDDALLAAGDKVIRQIAADPNSRYRKEFHSETAALTSGDVMPTEVGGVPIVGVFGTVRETNTNTDMQQVTKQQLDAYLGITLKQGLYYYAIESVRLWHTQPTGVVKADACLWSKTTQLALLAASPRGACPFNSDLHEAVVNIALSILFRGMNNQEQAEQWKVRGDQSLAEAFPRAARGE
jgi:hypothetical protein